MRSALFLLPLLTGPLWAQGITLPAGHASIDGNSSFVNWSSDRVLQILDASNPGVAVFNQLAFRRSTATISGATAGTIEVEVVLAETNFGLIDSVFAANQQQNVVQVLKGQVNLPDWTVASGTPGPFDLVMKFSQPWVYLGKNAICVTVRNSKSTWTANKSMDRVGGSNINTSGAAISTGCGSFDDYVRIHNTGAHGLGHRYHLRCNATGAPASAPVFLFIDVQDQDLTVPGLCAKLHASPLISILMGTADANGKVMDKYYGLPDLPGLQGLTLYTQLLTVDTSQPVLPLALTGGQKVTIPSNSATTGFPSCYLWTSGTNSTEGSGLITFGGCPVVELK